MKIESNVRRDCGSCGDDSKMQPQFLQQTTFESLEVKVKSSRGHGPMVNIVNPSNIHIDGTPTSGCALALPSEWTGSRIEMSQHDDNYT